MSSIHVPAQGEGVHGMRGTSRFAMMLNALLPDLLILLGLSVLIVVGSAWSYRQIFTYQFPITEKDGLPTSGLGGMERIDEQGYGRWTDPTLHMRFPGVGSANYVLEFVVTSPATDEPRLLTITAGQAMSQVVLQPGWQRIHVAVPARSMATTHGDLDLTLDARPPFSAPGDPRSLGVAIRSMSLEQLSAAIAPMHVLQHLVWLLVLVYLPLRVFGLSWRWTGILSAALVLTALLLLATTRIAVLLALPVVTHALLVAVIALPLLWWWQRMQPAVTRRWAGGVALVAIAIFVLHYAGMQHPQFEVIDHRYRTNQIEAIAEGRRDVVTAALNDQHEWGSGLFVPYSLLSYDIFVPLAHRVSSDALLAIVEGATAAFSAGTLFLLWGIARRSGLSGRASWWSAALFAVMPVVHLYFHDGSYPTIIGLWSAVLALWLLTITINQPRWWWLVGSLIAVAVSLLMYVTHLAFVPALLGSAIMSALFFGSSHLRWRMRWVAVAAGGGVLLALIGYYGAHLPTLLTQTIPEYVAVLTSGGSVGRDASSLPGPLLGSTWQQLWGHYRVIGIGIAGIGMLLALRSRDSWRTHVLVGYAIFVLLTVIADLRFGLWNKHLYFALPGVALAAGPVLSALQGRGAAGKLLALSIGGYFAWVAVEAWLLRVIHYVWSLETL